MQMIKVFGLMAGLTLVLVGIGGYFGGSSGAMLMFVILAVSTGPKEKGLMAGIAVGGVIAFEAVFAGPISGASMNPVRSLAPALVSGNLTSLWLYLTAPVIGAAVGVGTFRMMRRSTEDVAVEARADAELVR